MELSEFIPHIEALIFASDKPLTAPDLTELINNAMGFIEDRASLEQIETAVEGIKEKYDSEFYAFELKQIGGGWQFLTKPAFHKTVAQLNGDKFIKKLSTAALETLAIIAYKQPITKSEIESIRGVNCDYAVQKLLEKDLVIISGRNEDAVGKPLIYATSKSFMDYFGINRPEDLPQINELLLEKYEEATRMADLTNPQVLSSEEIVELDLPKEALDDVALDQEMETEVFSTEENPENDVDLVIAAETEITSDEEEASLEIENEEDENVAEPIEDEETEVESFTAINEEEDENASSETKEMENDEDELI